MDKPLMSPLPGERCLRFVGDSICFTLRGPGGRALPEGFRALLRTNLGRASVLQEEIIHSHAGNLPFAGASWSDIPMRRSAGEWQLELSLAEVGYFKAKAYAVDAHGRQDWPDGPDAGICVHPDRYRTFNTIYCAFVRMFGETKSAVSARDESSEAQLAALDQKGYAVIPPSGKLRHLIQQLPHIIDTLGCRILHLLPVNPTPAVYARFGRFGSPYASQDLTAIDPALVEFDRRTTGVDQFRELTYGVHLKGGRVFLDIVTNHTGWGSTLQENHPEWFLRDGKGDFVSPGAWGVTWEDLVEIDHRTPAPWDRLSEVFLTWCRRGVDGFRCDAGYKVPMPAWRYITARVRQEFPETIFLLEGLGGSWEATESLLTDGGMQWAYSELFQNYAGQQVAHYLDYAVRQSQRVGVYVHYSETHDNDRLAKKGRAWSLLRNRLCGLASCSGGFGFTSGVEWLAAEKIDVHRCSGLSWGNRENLVAELNTLNRLLGEHPCFFDHARLARLSGLDSPILALRRDSAEGADQVLVLINTDADHERTFVLDASSQKALGELRIDLLGRFPRSKARADGRIEFILAPAASHCLAPNEKPAGLAGPAYRQARAASAWAIAALHKIFPVEMIGPAPWRELAEKASDDPTHFLATISRMNAESAAANLLAAFDEAAARKPYPAVVVWRLSDRNRITPVPSDHWLLIQDDVRFQASLEIVGALRPKRVESIQARRGHVACFEPLKNGADATLRLERYAPQHSQVEARVRYLSSRPAYPASASILPKSELVLLTNGIGGMARLGVDLGRIQSKYDCLLGANLHASVPTDRHVLVKRVRVWVNADGFITALNEENLVEFQAGPPARWRFICNAGDGRTAEIHLEADMLEQRNTTVLRFSRPRSAPAMGQDLPDTCEVRLTIRLDLEDRNFHWETKRNPGADHHFGSNCRPLPNRAGFEFTPAADRRLRAFAGAGRYHHEAEWCENIPHPIEYSRGQTASGDAYSPGWFDLPLPRGGHLPLVVTADPEDPPAALVEGFAQRRQAIQQAQWERAELEGADSFGRQLALGAQAFVVRRGSAKTVIAGYPWFLDWGRDSLICARGLLAAGMRDEVKQLLLTFGRFEDNGTLPNTIQGEDASNRDTSDAPLWYGVVCEEMAAISSEPLYEMAVDARGRTLAAILRSIADGYQRGTSNGIRMDPDSALIWSPKHFTWMDTNFPAGTPRAGYPVEIQVLWIRLLRQLGRISNDSARQSWCELADRATASLSKYFWIEDEGYFSDLLIAEAGQRAAAAVRDNALRSNYLFAVSLGLVAGERAQRCVQAALRYLVVPGALRTLAPKPVSPPLPIHGNDGRLLNHPPEPYWGRYEGDEDTRRKPAYHNGTAWTWTFPTFCEALARAWDFEPNAVAAAKAYLGSMDRLLVEGCLGQLPEILDGDAPHTQRGCDAQAWGITEALRVWKLLNQRPRPGRAPAQAT